MLEGVCIKIDYGISVIESQNCTEPIAFVWIQNVKKCYMNTFKNDVRKKVKIAI